MDLLWVTAGFSTLSLFFVVPEYVGGTEALEEVGLVL